MRAVSICIDDTIRVISKIPALRVVYETIIWRLEEHNAQTEPKKYFQDEQELFLPKKKNRTFGNARYSRCGQEGVSNNFRSTWVMDDQFQNTHSKANTTKQTMHSDIHNLDTERQQKVDEISMKRST